jgi:hypothetical protein
MNNMTTYKQKTKDKQSIEMKKYFKNNMKGGFN